MQRRRIVVGRQHQLAALETARGDALAGGRFVLVTGAPGSGRTALLDAAADTWQAAGAVVLRVARPAADGPLAGFAAVLHVLREQYERLGDPLLARPLSTIGALCTGLRADVSGRLAVLAQQTSVAFGLIGRRVPIVLLADDVDDAPGLTTALAAAVRDGCLVVASARAGEGRLGAVAGSVVELPPMDAAAIGEMLLRRHGTPLDEAVLPALTTALGPLAGNPAAVVATVDALVGEGRLTGVRGHLCLLDPQRPIELPAAHRLITAIRDRGPAAVRLATMAAVTRFGLGDLPLFADATLGRLDSYGRVVDELVADGVLVAGPNGGIRPQSPALAARLITDAGPSAVARLHRAYAAAMFRRGAAVDRAALADHIACAGSAMPTDDRTAASLAAAAATVADGESGRAADWLRAALWHADPGRGADDILSSLMRLLVRTGQYGRLAEVADATTARTADHDRAAALAALHTGTGGPGFTERWLTGAGGLSAAVDRALTDGRDTADDLLVAASAGDLATLLRLALGEQYGLPADGPLAAYRRLTGCYQRGDLTGVVSAAREAELAGEETFGRLARLWAAEASRLLGRPDEARSWLDGVPDEAPYAALRWWAQGEPDTAEEATERLRSARIAVERQHGSRIGVEQLVARAEQVAARFGLAFGRPGVALSDGGIDPLRARGHRPALAAALLARGRTAEDARPYLEEAQTLADDMGSPVLRAAVAAAMRDRAVRRSRRRSPSDAFSEVELQIVGLIRRAYTNRQIAAQVRMSEKTIENYLTRLFARTGCRSRVELAAVSLTGEFALR